VLPFAGDTVTIVRAAIAADSYGNRARDWDDTTQTAVAAHVQPASTSEDRGARDREQAVSGYVVWVDAGTDVQATDRVVWAGRTFDVDGDPSTWSAPFVGGHVEFRIVASRG
jgi:head-tail adaptor